MDLLLAQLRGESVPNLSLVPFELIDADRQLTFGSTCAGTATV